MLALPAAVPAVGVKVAVRVRPDDPEIALRAPPATTTSPDEPSQMKLEPGSSLKVKVMAAVSPIFNCDTSLVIASVGARVSMLMAGLVPAPPTLPATSV